MILFGPVTLVQLPVKPVDFLQQGRIAAGQFAELCQHGPGLGTGEGLQRTEKNLGQLAEGFRFPESVEGGNVLIGE